MVKKSPFPPLASVTNGKLQNTDNILIIFLNPPRTHPASTPAVQFENLKTDVSAIFSAFEKCEGKIFQLTHLSNNNLYTSNRGEMIEPLKKLVK